MVDNADDAATEAAEAFGDALREVSEERPDGSIVRYVFLRLQ